jgi:protein-tyrosine-phosphatase
MKNTVLFLCQYGGAKSVMAMSYFNRRAEELSLPYDAVAAAAEEPYDAVPAPVVELLQRDGLDVRDFQPRHVEETDAAHATRVISIDCNHDGERWDDVPKVSEDLEGSAAAIREHVEALVAELHARR